MKYIFFFAFCVLVSLVKADDKQDWIKALRKLQKKCKKEIGLDDESYNNVLKKARADDSNRKEVRFVYCLAVREGFSDGKGNLGVEKIKSFLKQMKVDETTATESVEKCKNIKVPDDQPAAFNEYYKCFAKLLPKDVMILQV